MIRMTRWSVSIQSSLTPPYGTLLGEYGSPRMINKTIIDDKLVETLNLRILAGSSRFIFASRKEDWISRNAHRKVPSQPHLTFGAELIPASQ